MTAPGSRIMDVSHSFGRDAETPSSSPARIAFNGRVLAAVRPQEKVVGAAKAPAPARAAERIVLGPVLRREPQPVAREARFGGVDTAKTIVGEMGAPKEDKKFFCLGRKMSTRYKAVLAKMAEFEALKSQRVAPDTLEDLDRKLSEIKRTANEYLAAASRNAIKKRTIATLIAQIDRERAEIAKIFNQLEQGGRLPDGVTSRDVLDFVHQAGELVQLHDYVDAGFNEREGLHLARFGRSVADGEIYRQFGVPITANTVASTRPGPAVEIEFRELGRGRANTVYDGQIDGESVVYKPMKKPDGKTMIERGRCAIKTGVDPLNPKTALRNVSTYRLCKELGLDVIAHTEIMTGADAAGNPQLGVMMAKAPGKPAAECPSADFRRGPVLKKIYDLQLLDHLTGQGDRHQRNYFIFVSEDGKTVKVTGIDNDQCMGPLLEDPNGIAHEPAPKKTVRDRSPPEHPDENEATGDRASFRGCQLPPFVAQSTYDAFMRLTDDDLDGLLEGHSQQEISAAKARLDAIKYHLFYTCHTVEDDPWKPDRILEFSKAENSYAGRDHLFAVYRERPDAIGAGSLI
jgi:hypothetical protein